MLETVKEVHPEYWRPTNDEAARVIEPLSSESLCPNCETPLSIEGRFCQLCGLRRELKPTLPAAWSFDQLMDFEKIRQRLGLSTASLIFFIVGITCLAAAVLTGFLNQSTTATDWQALQFCRIEWLLASCAAMLAGILLKK